MENPTLTGFMIGLVLVSLVAGIFGLFLTEISTNYEVNTSEIDLEAFKQTDSLKEQTENIKNSTINIKQETGVLDVIGSFFSNSFSVLISIPQSLDLFTDMTEEAFLQGSRAGLGSGFNLIKSAIITIVIILIFIGIILPTVLKRTGKL